jgi:hypothetical protein
MNRHEKGNDALSRVEHADRVLCGCELSQLRVATEGKM